MSVLKLWPALVLVAVLAGGCGGNSTSGTQSTASPLSPVPDCPNSQGGTCLGELPAGTYQTRTFAPATTYTVPAGWWNLEDLPGNFLLLPPGRSLAEVDAGTSDYLGIYSGATVAAQDCTASGMPGVGLEPAAMVAALRGLPGLDTTTPREVSVGGLSGWMIDIEMAAGATGGCAVEDGRIIIPLFIGVGPAEVEHAQSPDLRTRLYVLANGDSNIIIEISDVPTDPPFPDPDSVVEGLGFSRDS